MPIASVHALTYGDAESAGQAPGGGEMTENLWHVQERERAGRVTVDITRRWDGWPLDRAGALSLLDATRRLAPGRYHPVTGTHRLVVLAPDRPRRRRGRHSVWRVGDPEPAGVGEVVDRQRDPWVRGPDGWRSTVDGITDEQALAWPLVLLLFGPVRASRRLAGVAGCGRRVPTPTRAGTAGRVRVWRLAHPSG